MHASITDKGVSCWLTHHNGVAVSTTSDATRFSCFRARNIISWLTTTWAPTEYYLRLFPVLHRNCLCIWKYITQLQILSTLARNMGSASKSLQDDEVREIFSSHLL
jgi:hypothetical protein